jgi:hypothetical protein
VQIPLAKKLKECRVFGVSCDEFLDYALDNRGEWESKGQEIVGLLVEEAALRYGEHVCPEKLVRQAQERRASDKEAAGAAMPPEQAGPMPGTMGDGDSATGQDELNRTGDTEGELKPADLSREEAPEATGNAEHTIADLASELSPETVGFEEDLSAGRGENKSPLTPDLRGAATGGQNGVGSPRPKGKGPSQLLRNSNRNQLDEGARFI